MPLTFEIVKFPALAFRLIVEVDAAVILPFTLILAFVILRPVDVTGETLPLKVVVPDPALCLRDPIDTLLLKITTAVR